MANKSKKEKSRTPFVFVDPPARKKLSATELPVRFTEDDRIIFAPGVSVESLKMVILEMHARILEMGEFIGGLQSGTPPSVIIKPSTNGRDSHGT